jgi:hypothetical protein
MDGAENYPPMNLLLIIEIAVPPRRINQLGSAKIWAGTTCSERRCSYLRLICVICISVSIVAAQTTRLVVRMVKKATVEFAV